MNNWLTLKGALLGSESNEPDTMCLCEVYGQSPQILVSDADWVEVEFEVALDPAIPVPLTRKAWVPVRSA